MSVNFLTIDFSRENLSNNFDILCYFLIEKIRRKLFTCLLFFLFSIEFDNAGIVKIADFFKACFINITLYITIDLYELFKLA